MVQRLFLDGVSVEPHGKSAAAVMPGHARSCQPDPANMDSLGDARPGAESA
jgi:hypothetical protein